MLDISVIEKQRAMIIIRHHRPFDVKGLFSTARDSGFNCIEITMNTPGACSLIKEAEKNFSGEMVIGAGTVLSVDEAKAAIDSGSGFIVSPLFDPLIVDFCVNRGIPVFPGVMSPSEIYAAHNLGAHMVKVFPALTFGPAFIQSIKKALPPVKVLAVGGIRHDSVMDFLSTGTDAVALGAGVIKPQWVESGDYTAIASALEQFKQAMNEYHEEELLCS